VRDNLRAYSESLLAEWDPYLYGVMHEHVPVRGMRSIPVPIAWILGVDSSPWMAGLHDRVVRHRPDIRTVRLAGAGHLVHPPR
jgi:hypothetical protein